MKFKNILSAAVFCLIIQTSFAARLTVYNESGNVFDVTMHADGKVVKVERIYQNKEATFNSGFSRFSSIVWGIPRTVEQGIFNGYFKTYKADIPSSMTMLTGSVMLGDKQGHSNKISINFDKDGVSDKALRTFSGIQIQ